MKCIGNIETSEFIRIRILHLPIFENHTKCNALGKVSTYCFAWINHFYEKLILLEICEIHIFSDFLENTMEILELLFPYRNQCQKPIGFLMFN